MYAHYPRSSLLVFLLKTEYSSNLSYFLLQNKNLAIENRRFCRLQNCSHFCQYCAPLRISCKQSMMAFEFFCSPYVVFSRKEIGFQWQQTSNRYWNPFCAAVMTHFNACIFCGLSAFVFLCRYASFFWCPDIAVFRSSLCFPMSRITHDSTLISPMIAFI